MALYRPLQKKHRLKKGRTASRITLLLQGLLQEDWTRAAAGVQVRALNKGCLQAQSEKLDCFYCEHHWLYDGAPKS